MMKTIDELSKTLGEKAKRETKTYVEELCIYKETIEESELLVCLKESTQTTETHALEDCEMQETHPELAIVCSRCKKEVEQEEEVQTKIREAVIEANAAGNLEGNIKTLLDKRWPIEVFTKSKVEVGSPLQKPDPGELALILNDKKDDAGIIRKFKEVNPELVKVIAEELIPGQAQYVERVSKTRGGAESRKRVYVTCGKETEERLNAIKDLESEMRSTGCKALSIVVPEEESRWQIRKLIEIVFYKSEIEITMYAPKREGLGKFAPKPNRYDSFVVKSSTKSYADLLKDVREHINPASLGVEIKTIKKTKDESLLIVTEKDKTELLKKEIRDHSTITDLNISEKRCEIIITGMDAVTTVEEIKEALGKTLDTENSELKISLYVNKSGSGVATLSAPRTVASKILDIKTLTIGWCRCRVKEKITIVRCTNCLKVGHIAKACRSKPLKAPKCLNCTKEEHLARDCTNAAYCTSCEVEGHRPDSMRCHKYRKMVYQKERASN